MKQWFERFVMWVSLVCLVAAAILIAVGLAGLTPSAELGLALMLVTMGVYGAIDLLALDELWYFRRLWLSTLIPTLVAIFGIIPSWSPGEVQAVGGLIGLVGVGNLFLRPVYRLLFYVVESTVQIAREIQEERSS